MDKVAVSLDEQETVLIIVPAKVGNRINVYSSIPADVRYYQRLVAENPDDVTLIREDSYGVEVELPSSWFRRPKRPNKRQLTEEQRAEAAARLRAARANRREV